MSRSGRGSGRTPRGRRRTSGTRRGEVPPELSELITISRAVGSDPDLVQGGGGNTSVKTRDGKTILVKASGAALADMSEEAGWAALDLEAVRGILEETRLTELPADEREAQVLSLLRSAVRFPLEARPSVEASLHALLDRVVIHTHPVHLNAFLCARGSREACAKLLSRLRPPPLYVPYVDPGFVLAQRLRSEIDRYRERHGRLPGVVLLENHGLFVGASDVESCLKLSSRVTGIGRRASSVARVNPVHFGWIGAPGPGRTGDGSRRDNGAASRSRKARARMSDRGADVPDATAELRGALLRGGSSPVVLRRDDTTLAVEFASLSGVGRLVRRGAFTPDQIVYCRTCPLVLEGRNPEVWVRAVERYRDATGRDPRVVIRPGDGVYYAAPTLSEVRVVAETYRSAMTAIQESGGDGVRFLNRRQASFIEDWEVEAYRARVVSGPSASRGSLGGRIAIVTGAASGLGKGISRGLVRAGATIVGLDLNEAQLEETSREFAGGRFLPVRVDVTNEESIARALRIVEASVGGADILVNAAGIAPSFPLVDFPLGAWQKTLDINLTGYFLCAREVTRMLLRQNAGGSIINVTSKSGLDASKANSAYNATKAGEIHLMRGWALELGPAGIRVNCIAPGNVFKGSQIWNEEYIRAAAKKKGIRPEEVIPYYTSLSPLGQEIEPEDVANGVVYLVSDEGRRVTGQTLVVDGGQVMVR